MSTPPPQTTNASIQASVLQRFLWNGETITQSLIEPDFASYGSSDESLEAMSLFLEEHLQTLEASVLSQYCLPEEAALTVFRVHIEHPTLPKRLDASMALDVPCVVVPLGADTWIHIVPLGHIMYVRSQYPVAERVQDEIVRLLSVREADPGALLRLFPDRGVSLRVLGVKLDVRDELDPLRSTGWRKKLARAFKEKQARAILDSVADPMHTESLAHRGPEVVHRERDFDLMRTLLESDARGGVLLVGERGCGKTALLWHWLRQQRDAKMRVYATSGARLIAGMSGLGQWQERVQRVCRALEVLGAVLYMDDVADLFTENDKSHVDIPSALKPFLEQGRIRLLAEVTPKKLDLFERKNVGFFQACTRIRIKPLTEDQTRDALSAHAAFVKTQHTKAPVFSEEAQDALMRLCARYVLYGVFPGKAISQAMELYSEALQHSKDNQTIQARDVYRAFAHTTGVPEFLLREDTALKLRDLQETLQKRVIGQREAVRRVAETLCVVKARLQPGEKPLSVFLFAGPTGVGKTELARSLAHVLFGDDERMIRFDMSEFTDPLASHRLIQGTDRDEGLLTRVIRRQPFSVLLLDEIEKAHPSVFDLLLQVCGEGRLTDAKGKTVYFQNAIIIMTSNLGALTAKRTVGLGALPTSEQSKYEAEVIKRFRPEFVNRLDRIVVFQSLQHGEISEIIHLFLRSIQNRRGLVEAGIKLTVTDEAKVWLAELGCSPEHGARALRRVLDTYVVTPISRMISAAGTQAAHGEIHIQHASQPSLSSRVEPIHMGALRISLTSGADRISKRDKRSIAELSHARRVVQHQLSLGPVESVLENIRFIAAQINYGAHQGDARILAEMSRLQTEHHRLDQLYTTAQRAAQDIETLEEMCIVALLAEEPVEELAQEIVGMEQTFRSALLPLLVAQDTSRDHITLMLTEVDDHKPSRFWLIPFLQYCEEMSWSCTVHLLRGEDPGHGDPSWPADRQWGPPRSAAWLLKSLETNLRRLTRVLVRVHGTNAGSYLSLECGVHRWDQKTEEGHQMQMTCSNVGLFSNLKDEDWDDPALAKPTWVPAEDLAKHPAVRLYTSRGVQVARQKHAVVECDWAKGLYWDCFEEVALTHMLLFVDPPEGVQIGSRSSLLQGSVDRSRSKSKEKKSS